MMSKKLIRCTVVLDHDVCMTTPLYNISVQTTISTREADAIDNEPNIFVADVESVDHDPGRPIRSITSTAPEGPLQTVRPHHRGTEAEDGVDGSSCISLRFTWDNSTCINIHFL